jgi:hypothetical protein
MVKKIYFLMFFLINLSTVHSKLIIIKPEDSHTLGQKIWHNECNGTIEGLTTWNLGEDFASLGIGHFIWRPSGGNGTFKETFPSLLTYLKNHGKHLPQWLENSIKTGCPWSNRPEFIAAQKTKHMQELRQLLVNSIDLQTQFIIERFIAMAQSAEIKKILSNKAFANLSSLAQTQQGLYALIDYINFKGEGFSENLKSYGNQGWGLLQVLETMNTSKPRTEPLKAFAQAAKQVLKQRVANAPPERHEERWIPGWFKRIDTYSQESL